MRLIGYARVSTKEQGDSGHGLNAQRDAIAAWCRAQGHDLVDSETEVVSRRRTDKMVGRARAINRLHGWPATLSEAEGLVGSKLDRITGSVLDAAQLVQRSYAERWVLLTVGGTNTSSTAHESSRPTSGRHSPRKSDGG